MKIKLLFTIPALVASMALNAQNTLNPYPSYPAETERNVFLGFAGYRNTTGLENTFVGYNAGSVNTTGHFNTSIGTRTGSYNNGDANVFIGASTGHYTTGSSNVMIGNHAGYKYQGNYNILLGNGTAGGYPGNSFTGTNNIIIGSDASQTANDISNAIAIGKNAKISKSNTFILGGIGEDAVNVGVGTSDPSAKLHTIGSVRHEGIENGEGNQLVIDADGNVKQSDINYKAEIDALKAEIQALKSIMVREGVLEVPTNSAPANRASIYPNPASGKFTVNFVPQNKNNITVKVMETSGKVVSEKNYSNKGTEFSQEISVEGLQKGIYFVSITDGKKVEGSTVLVK
jgi:hypothetical protein